MKAFTTSDRKTKIIATLGPVSSSPEMIEQLMAAGVDLFRLNFSHGTNEQRREVIAIIRRLSGERGKEIGILADLQGPKIRTGRMENGAIQLITGTALDITTNEVLGRPGLISTIYRALPRDVKPGSRILLDDGLIELKVTSVTGNTVHCTVVAGGILKDLKGINLPGVHVSAPSLSAKDLADLDFCLEQRVDYIALSFVRAPEDVDDLKRILYERNIHIPVVAKIEKPEALRNFKGILAIADAVMVARGDLGVEINPEKVPLIQKEIIRACNEAGKPVITATQMLESMINHPRPTRAETSDVANAILDGTDAVMLSGETASGQFPLEAVKTMDKVALDVERYALEGGEHSRRHSASIAEAVAEAACHAAVALKAKAIAVHTQSGSSAARISRYRPPLPIIAFTQSVDTMRRLSLYWGVKPRPIGSMTGTDEQICAVESSLLATGYHKGDVIVITMGVPVEARGSTNLMKVHKLGTGQFYEIF
ncbi:pyruvate kinase [Geotalea uraniireducens]|uniref:Pyruvate kinase n=1 Tax=Geotalea uraniireducens TaxID=351604 RepID=A0ABM8ER45_9BACT|nr:pyruvate kinase [Geotalea uraniireducens]BDV44791.1 pyruvate kinase [Geotalea uraniireducens]